MVESRWYVMVSLSKLLSFSLLLVFVNCQCQPDDLQKYTELQDINGRIEGDIDTEWNALETKPPDEAAFRARARVDQIPILKGFPIHNIGLYLDKCGGEYPPGKVPNPDSFDKALEELDPTNLCKEETLLPCLNYITFISKYASSTEKWDQKCDKFLCEMPESDKLTPSAIACLSTANDLKPPLRILTSYDNIIKSLPDKDSAILNTLLLVKSSILCVPHYLKRMPNKGFVCANTLEHLRTGYNYIGITMDDVEELVENDVKADTGILSSSDIEIPRQLRELLIKEFEFTCSKLASGNAPQNIGEACLGLPSS